jgi:hypothetical protein
MSRSALMSNTVGVSIFTAKVGVSADLAAASGRAIAARRMIFQVFFVYLVIAKYETRFSLLGFKKSNKMRKRLAS